MDRVVRAAEAAVGTEVRGARDGAGRRGRAHDLAIVDEQPLQLDAHFEPDAVVPADRDVAARLRALGLHHFPDQPAALGDQAGEVLLARDRSLPRDTALLSVTLDPAFDTPPILEAYARAKGADPARWRFATGKPDDVLRVARAFSVYVEKNGALLDHTLATALVDGDGRVVEIWRGNGWKAADVADALREHRES